LTQKQIAERLSVSERTIRRDVAKLRPYQERNFRHQLRLLEKERDAQFEAQLKTLTKLIAQRNKALNMREYYHHQIFVSIDLDKMNKGFPKVRI
jgi:transcriptional antiterminator